jgi:CRISPR-associated endonuclease/helicase Cas3
MLDAGEVARLIWREWLPEAVRTPIVTHTGSEVASEALLVWLSGVHDLGKATPGFQYKVVRLADRVRALGLTLPNPPPTRPEFHALMSQALLGRWLIESHGWNKTVALTYAIVPGGHHGTPPNKNDLERLLKQPVLDEGLGGSPCWRGVQEELMQWASEWTGIKAHLPHLADQALPPTLQMLITGVVIMADWIASNSEYFPLFPEDHALSATERAERGWTQVELPPAWEAVTELPPPDRLLHARFDQLPTTATLRPAQRTMVEAAQQLTSPGLIIMEAPMGSGKTEAALLAAEIIASHFGQGGVAFLLPTMATSNAMFSRVLSWLSHVPDATASCRPVTMNLVHGKAALNDDFSHLRWRTSSMGDLTTGRTPDSLVAPGWLAGRKRSLLSSFVVGTVDQLLMAGLKAKHVVLRHLGLAGKVVIIDEVHAYDAYMSVYLDRVLSWLGAYAVPVILLSATLPPSRRQAMIEAYSAGESTTARVPELSYPETGEYPLITSCDRDGVRFATCSDDTHHLDVAVEEIPDDDDALVTRLTHMLSNGGCAGVIRDTVTRAQATYEALRAQFGEDVLLLHSRFIACDRLAKDEDLLQRLGGGATRRPRRLIVVGTQVLEQSLDIDFDLLVTDIAPVDLLLQRIGRLHRHRKWDDQRPAPLRQARCLLTGVSDWSAEPPALDRLVTAIYERALLWRTIAALRKRVGGSECEVHLPDDIAPLVNAVYEWADDQADLPPAWIEPLHEATREMINRREQKISDASVFLLPDILEPGQSVTGLLKADFVDADDDNRRGQAAVRDTEDSVEVVVVQRTSDGVIRLLPWVDRTTHPARQQKMSDPSSIMDDMNESPLARELSAWGEPEPATAQVAATCTVTLPFIMNRPWLVDGVIAALESQGDFTSWQESRWLRGALPLVLDESFSASLKVCDDRRFDLHYDPTVGLRLLREDHDE